MYNKTESAWRDVIQETLGKEYFAEGLGQVQTNYLQYQEIVNKMSEAYLKSVNMPSREEVANIATLIINMESKIDDVEDQLDDLNDSTAKELEQLKKTVSNLDKKLDRILDLLDKEEKQAPAAKVVAPAANVKATAPVAPGAKK